MESLESQEVSLQGCEIASKKQGMSDVGQGKVIHMLPHLMMTDTWY